MSPFLTRAEEIAARFRSLAIMGTGADAVTVIVDRQKNILSEITSAVAKKAKGVAVTVLWVGGKAVDGNPLVMDALYEVSVYAKPIMREGEEPADELVAALVPAIHQWQADGTAHCDWEFRVSGDIDLIPDKSLNIYFFPVTGRVRLIQPTTT